jgi:hypothetical protein
MPPHPDLLPARGEKERSLAYLPRLARAAALRLLTFLRAAAIFFPAAAGFLLAAADFLLAPAVLAGRKPPTAFLILPRVNAATAGELFLKAIISKEHPLLIFRDLFQLDDPTNDDLRLEHLIQKGRTYDFEQLPKLLWVSTGERLPDP